MDASVFVALITAVLGGGLIAAVVAFRKSGPEVESINVSTMRTVIEELRSELTRLQTENERLHKSITDLQEVAHENIELRNNVLLMESRLRSLERGS